MLACGTCLSSFALTVFNNVINTKDEGRVGGREGGRRGIKCRKVKKEGKGRKCTFYIHYVSHNLGIYES